MAARRVLLTLMCRGHGPKGCDRICGRVEVLSAAHREVSGSHYDELEDGTLLGFFGPIPLAFAGLGIPIDGQLDRTYADCGRDRHRTEVDLAALTVAARGALEAKHPRRIPLPVMARQ